MSDAIYQRKKLQPDKTSQNSPLDTWFSKMILKTEEELSDLDIARMLRQNIYLDIAIPCAWDHVLADPFCGELYDGEVLEMLMKVLSNGVQACDRTFYSTFIENIQQQIEVHEWLDSQEKEEFQTMLREFGMLFE